MKQDFKRFPALLKDYRRIQVVDVTSLADEDGIECWVSGADGRRKLYVRELYSYSPENMVIVDKFRQLHDESDKALQQAVKLIGTMDKLVLPKPRGSKGDDETS